MADPPARPAGESRIWAGGLSAAAMLTLVATMALARRDTLSAGQLDPSVWWHVGRASGLIAWALLGVAVIGGMALSTQLACRRIRSWAQGLHEFIGVLAVVFTAVHLAAVLAAKELDVEWRQLVVPFTREAAPVAQACGVLACYLLLAVATTSWMRRLLPWRWWRRTHLLSFPLFGLACAHTVLAGSDTRQPLFVGLSAAVGLVTLFLLIVSLLTRRGAARTVATPAPMQAAAVQSPPAAAPAGGPGAPDLLLLVAQAAWEADAVLSLRLVRPDRSELPAWEPGAHISLVLASGRVRQYSLFGDPAERDHYRIAVLRQDAGGGGSREIHTELRVGTRLAVMSPRNDFPLVPAPAYLFIAGGIGITGVLAMVSTVAASGGDWRLVYVGRSRSAMAFVDQVLLVDPARVEIAARDEHGPPDLDGVIARQVLGTSVYCCGPERLLHAVTALTVARGDLNLHWERFAAAPVSGTAFHVELSRTGSVVEVAADQTVLQAVRSVLPAVPSSCGQGVCGACRTTVLAGEPDHRDTLLSDAERADRQMLICVSRAAGALLVLDL